MEEFNLDNKTFALVDNSSNGKVSLDTVFHYKQDANLVTADYFGGPIKYGKIIAHFKDGKLHMLYQCLTIDDELKAGKAIADVTKNSEGKIRLSLNWEWLTEKNKTGTSEYLEVS